MKPVDGMTQAEVGAFVQTHLRVKGIEVVLTGGGAVSICAVGKYVLADLDLGAAWLVLRIGDKGASRPLQAQGPATFWPMWPEGPWPIGPA